MNRRRWTLVSMLFAQLLGAGCASNITTENSVVATVCEANGKDLIRATREVVSGMKNYSIRQVSDTEIRVNYDPTNPVMGSATVRVWAANAAGVTRDGRRVTGSEVNYKDATGFFSQDSSFGGADIIVQIKSAMDEYTKFQGISCVQARRQ